MSANTPISKLGMINSMIQTKEKHLSIFKKIVSVKIKILINCNMKRKFMSLLSNLIWKKLKRDINKKAWI
jgi:hypothetical protein